MIRATGTLQEEAVIVLFLECESTWLLSIYRGFGDVVLDEPRLPDKSGVKAGLPAWSSRGVG